MDQQQQQGAARHYQQREGHNHHSFDAGGGGGGGGSGGGHHHPPPPHRSASSPPSGGTGPEEGMVPHMTSHYSDMHHPSLQNPHPHLGVAGGHNQHISPPGGTPPSRSPLRHRHVVGHDVEPVDVGSAFAPLLPHPVSPPLDDADVAAGNGKAAAATASTTASSTSASTTATAPEVGPGGLRPDHRTAAAPVGILKRTDGRVNRRITSLQTDMDGMIAAEMNLKNKPQKRSTMTVLGMDISHLRPNVQFFVCAGGVFGFSLVYGFLQELLTVQICCRRLGLFLAMVQFTGYTLWSYVFRVYVDKKQSERNRSVGYYDRSGVVTSSLTPSSSYLSLSELDGLSSSQVDQSAAAAAAAAAASGLTSPSKSPGNKSRRSIPTRWYVGLSLLRAVDLGMTNLAMQFVNYPAKTLMKSSRVVWTMMFGVIVGGRTYGRRDYVVVSLMVTGLALFMHADAHSSAVFQPIGIVMLATALMCDGAISNVSESLMKQYNVGQDEYIFRLYSIALVAIAAAAAVKGDLVDGITFLSVPGTVEEVETGSPPTWSAGGKALVFALFSTTGFFGSSCAAAITKEFGALTMSITSTARKATTLFLSFAIFKNECTVEHVGGIVIFISSLVVKSLRSKRKGGKGGTGREKDASSPPASSSSGGGVAPSSGPFFRKRRGSDDALGARYGRGGDLAQVV